MSVFENVDYDKYFDLKRASIFGLLVNIENFFEVNLKFKLF